MKEILRSQWNYMLYDKEGKLVFSVICGSIAIYEIIIILNDDEIGKYNEHGEKFLTEFAEQIRKNPKVYSERYINLNNEALE